MEEPARVRALAELFDYLGHQNARKQEAGELDNVDKDVVFSVEDEVGYEVERDLLGNFADKEENIRKEEHEQGTVLEQERKAFLDARRVRLMLRALAGVAVGQARENDYEHRGDYRGGQISLRGVILEIGEQSRARTRLRRPELYEEWCATHPITELPKWKRGENVRLVKTEEQFRAAAQLFSEGRRDLGRGCWTEEGLAEWTPEYFYDQLKEEKAQGWACYLHYTKNEPDGMISVDHKGGRIEHLFIAASARGKGIGQKMLDFARKKLPEHAHPELTVLDKNTRAIALYRRMGWKVCGVAEVFDPAKDGSVTARAELLEMRYDGPAEA